MPIRPVNTATVMTREHPFDPGASTSVMSTGLVTESTRSSLAQTTDCYPGPEVLPTGNESTQSNKSLPCVRPDELAGESDSEAEVDGEPASPASVHVQDELPEGSADQDLSEDANYKETIRGVRSFMGWHQIPDYDSTSSSLDDNPFANR